MENNDAATLGSDNVTTQTGLGALGAETSSSQTTETNTTTEVTTSTIQPFEKFHDILTEDGKFSEKWTERLPDGLKDFSKTLSKFKDPTELMASYATLEKAFSQKSSANAVKIPGDDAKDEDWAKYRDAIGAPKDIKEYGLTRPEEIPEDQWNGKLAEKAATVAQKYGIPKKALQELVGEYNNSMKDFIGTAEQQQAKIYQDTVSKFESEWKDSSKTNWQKAARAANVLGLDPNDPSIVREDIVKALLKVDDMLSEDQKLVTGDFSETYQEKLSKLQASDDYKGKNGYQAQMNAHNKALELAAKLAK